MKISINGNIIDTELIYKITEKICKNIFVLKKNNIPL